MKSNFGKSKRWAPKSGKQRTIKKSPSARSLEPVITKPLDMDAIKKAQEELKNKKSEEMNESTDSDNEKNKS